MRPNIGPLRDGELPRAGGSAGTALSAELVFNELLKFQADVGKTRDGMDLVRQELSGVRTTQSEMVTLLGQIRDLLTESRDLLRETKELLTDTHERQTQMLESMWRGGAQMQKLEQRMVQVEEVVQARVDQESDT
jgi:hypothetical protein